MRRRCGFWVVFHSVKWPSDEPVLWATTARASMALGTTRLLTTSILTTCLASVNALSVAAASPSDQSKIRLGGGMPCFHSAYLGRKRERLARPA